MNGQKGTPVNAILIALVGILIGFIGGYWIGQSRAPVGGAAGLTTAQQGAVTCPHSLDPKDLDIIAGFRCPGTDDAQVLLSDCHCAVSHGIHDLVKAELATGKTHAEIRQQLIDQYGDRLKLQGQ
ncbi:MAG TPA: hypothetical protein VM118_13600 [Acidobacteriota bacterium]|nr:hypothetical protein [Acidobacteriota bacterium]